MYLKLNNYNLIISQNFCFFLLFFIIQNCICNSMKKNAVFESEEEDPLIFYANKSDNTKSGTKSETKIAKPKR